MRVSQTPVTVITVNGEVQTKEEATVYVKEKDRVVTVQVLEDTPAVLSVGKHCEEHGYSYEWTSGQLTTSREKWHKDSLQKEKPRADCCPRIVNRLLQLVFKYVLNIVFAGRRGHGVPKASNRRRRTCKGPEPACVRPPFNDGGGTRRGRKGGSTSCRGAV